MIDTIIDLYHGNSIDLPAAQAGGIKAVIHKATEGGSFMDHLYHQRRIAAKNLGLLWGAYHFSTGESVADQVHYFLAYAKPEEDELIALDWEPSNGPDMTLAQAREFVQMIKNETGRWPVLYAGHLLRENLQHITDDILCNCPLWYARYASAPIGIPTHIWPNYTLWQYTDGNVGPEPHATPGAHSGVDRNIFPGSAEELSQQWPFTRRSAETPFGPGYSAILSQTSPTVIA